MKLLIVEDYRPLRDATCQSFRESGYVVESASNGSDGLFVARTSQFDCIILDWMLPQIAGIEILRSLRQEGNNTPILMLTAKDTTIDRVHGLDSGADDYLIKPFTLVELQARVRALIRRRHQVTTSIIQVSDMAIDLVSKTMSRAGLQIELTAKEFALLELLALRMGQVVSRTEIWNHIYDENDNSTSNVVDVYIGYLRRKLESNGGTRLIYTRRGFGYVLESHS